VFNSPVYRIDGLGGALKEGACLDQEINILR